MLAKWEDRRERYLSLGEERTLVQDRALSGTRKVVELFQKMNLAFSECQPVMQVRRGCDHTSPSAVTLRKTMRGGGRC